MASSSSDGNCRTLADHAVRDRTKKFARNRVSSTLPAAMDAAVAPSGQSLKLLALTRRIPSSWLSSPLG
jgi:hypothetical protein